jgi:hypothetical protein
VSAFAARFALAAAALLSACSLDLSGNDACETNNDCIAGYTCAANRCKREGSGGTGGGGTGGIGSIDGGPNVTPGRKCPEIAVTSCSPENPAGVCEQVFCGGKLWQDGVMHSILVPFQILDPDEMFSAAYREAIRASAAAWTRASGGFVRFQECPFCVGRFIAVVPGDGDGITNPDAVGQQNLPMPVLPDGHVSPHRIAHQWGHVVGLSHTYERADRDRYVGFDPELWCPPGGGGLPPRCAAGPAISQELPAVTSGTFGVFDEQSKMNGLHREGICGAPQPDEGSGEPTIGDLSAAAELFFGATTGWSPFRPIGRSVSPTQPLDYQLAPGVDPVGSPAIAEIDYARPEIFVRGSDDRVYMTGRDPSSATSEWSEWTPIADDVDADPAAVFATNANPATLYVAVRSQRDAQIHLRHRRGDDWVDWTTIGAPPSGAASAPALASESPFSLAVVVRGGDGLIYWFACADAEHDCASDLARPNAWSALPAPPSGIFVGKPSAVWWRDDTALMVAGVRDDRVAMVITRVNDGGIDWIAAANVNGKLSPDDPNPGVAITISSTPGDPVFFARNHQGLMVSDTLRLGFFPIGGVLASPPGATAVYKAFVRMDVAAIIHDHGHPGVWWRYNDGDYVAPCHYNRPGTCAECGL